MPSLPDNERAQIQQAFVRDAFEILAYYEVLAFRKSRDDYDPYAYVYEQIDGVEDEELTDWDWEDE